MWLITDTSPERPASAVHRTEGGGKACGTGLHSGSDLKMDASKALGLGYGREVLFVRNLHRGLGMVRGGCLKEAELKVRLKGSRTCTGRERGRGEQALSGPGKSPVEVLAQE